MTTLNPSDGLAVFSDGSAHYKDRSGGWGYVVLDAFDGLIKDSGYQAGTTISQMELTAPTQALNHLYEEHGACEVLVYSDSEYVVKGASDRTRKRNKNKLYWQRLDKAIERHTYVEFLHVRGHSDHLFNEMADELAGKARHAGVAQTQESE